jgi:HD superfamily phosphodiesterase
MEYSTDKILQAMRDYMGDDGRRKKHAAEVFCYACKIQAVEGGDIQVVETAATLHDIGIHEAERKYNSAAGHYQEIEGPSIAREILYDFDISREKVDHICKIIANHHTAKDIDTLEFKIIWDADWLVNIPDEFDINNKIEIKKIVNKVFKTKKGRELAKEEFRN